MSDADHKALFDSNGFVVVRQFLPEHDLTELRQEIARFMRDVLPTLPHDQAFYHKRPDGTSAIRQVHRMNCDPYFEAYRSHTRWVDLAQSLVGESVKANTPQWLSKPPNTLHATPPHQDNRYFCLVPANAVMIFVALEPIDEENGCLRYVPGSHKQGVRTHGLSGVLGFSRGITDFGPGDSAEPAVVHLEPGDASCHHPETIHWADPNRSAVRSREAFAMLFQGESCHIDQEAFEAYQRDARRLLELR